MSAKYQVLNHRSTLALLSVIRNKNTSCPEFRRYADRLHRLLAEEALTYLPCQAVVLESPCGEYEGVQGPPVEKICVVSILRSGDSLCSAFETLLPGVSVGKVLIQRDETTALPKFFFAKLPHDIASRQVILVDPMLATGGSCVCAVECLKEKGVLEENILFVNVVSCPEGLEVLARDCPKMQILTATVDKRLNEHKYIVPGCGDYGDRYFNTVHKST
eukprot:c19070_g1_i1.p1 GENE.c19070_g1_i1~~c19070_g1_i1.p1  ORF type:complete len:236 (+),score=48.64 c19070_g1_i1:57-710(+)